jgi:hypothetical protein
MGAVLDCPLDEPYIAAFRRLTQEGIARDALPAIPLPDVRDDRLIASLIVRRVRARGGSADASVDRERSVPTRSCQAESPTSSGPVAHVARPSAVTDDRWPEAVLTLFAELACRRLHTLTVQEGRG